MFEQDKATAWVALFLLWGERQHESPLRGYNWYAARSALWGALRYAWVSTAHRLCHPERSRARGKALLSLNRSYGVG